jgi:hypothetical protein
LENKVDAIPLPWQPGQEGGNSVADVFWKSNPFRKINNDFSQNMKMLLQKTGLELLLKTLQM